MSTPPTTTIPSPPVQGGGSFDNVDVDSAPHIGVNVEFTLTVWGVVFVIIAALVATLAFVWALLRAAYFPAPVALVVALSTLSLTSIGAAMLTGNGDFVTLSATGIGALAGAVSATYQHLKAQDLPPIPPSDFLRLPVPEQRVQESGAETPPDTEVSQHGNDPG